MAITPATPAKPGSLMKGAGIFVLGAFTTALVGGPVGLYFANRANTVALVQQQKLGEVQQFESTGGALDNAVRQFSDAMVDGDESPLEEARRGLRAAIAAHSAQVFAMRNTLGEEDYRRYMAVLDTLRQRADAQNATEGVQTWQSAADLIGYRRRLADRIKAEVAAT